MKKSLLSIFAAMALIACGKGGTSTTSPVTPTTDPKSSTSESHPWDDYTPKDPIDIDPFDRTYEKLPSDSAYVRKIEGIGDQNFIMGMDASSVIAEEKSGVKYYDFAGNEADVFKVMSDAGINYIRVRVWNDPFDEEGHGYGGGNNDLTTAIAIGKRATQYNMSLLVDFHYSDFWADPAKQMVPKAWADYSVSEKADAIYEYTKSSLQAMKDEGIKVGMVQIGNETNSGKFCGEVTFPKMVQMMKKASQAIREVCPEALVAVHFANPEKANNYRDWAARIKDLDYDVFGTSYYPYWHGTLENLSSILSEIAATYDKRVMVLETSYCYTGENTDFYGNTISETSGYNVKNYPFTVHGQINSVLDIIDTIANKTINGLGVCYWEGPWISVGTSSWEENSQKWEQFGSGWAASYAADYDPDDAGQFYGGCAVDNQAFFDETGHPLESLKLWNLCRFGNEIEKFVDGVGDVEEIHYDNETFTLPATVDAIFSDNSRSPIPVVWDDFDIEAAKAAGNGKYDIHGVAGGRDVLCHLTIMEYNYIQNYSFETGDHTGWILDNRGAAQSSTNIIKVTNENKQTGTYAFHWWTSGSDGVNFELKQEITGAKPGKFKLQASFLGGNNGSTDLNPSSQNIYLFAEVDGVQVGKKSHTITKWADGYKDCLLSSFDYAGGKLVVGIHVQVSEGCWGDIDDVMLNATN